MSLTCQQISDMTGSISVKPPPQLIVKQLIFLSVKFQDILSSAAQKIIKILRIKKKVLCVETLGSKLSDATSLKNKRDSVIEITACSKEHLQKSFSKNTVHKYIFLNCPLVRQLQI